MQAVLDGLLAQDRFDVVAVEDNVMGVYDIAGDTPRVLTEHEARRSSPPAHGPGVLRGAAQRIVRRENTRRWAPYLETVWRSFDVVQTFSEPDAEVVRRVAGQGGPRVVVNPFGIDLPPLRPAPKDDELVVFIGNYLHAPNLDAARWLAEDIFPRVRERRPGAVLALAGGHAPAWLRALEGDGVRVLGAVEDADALLRRGAVVVAPVRTGGGMRMKVLHAMALGAAVVTTSLGIEGLAGQGHVPPVVVADDAAGHAEAVARLLEDPARRAGLGAEARAFVERRHSPAAYADRLLETYRVAIEGRSA
jgi:glycosyltransferase involved in cell wall biosynthesis